MKKEEKEKITKESIDEIFSLMRMYNMDFTESTMKGALAIFLAGVNFLGNKLNS